MSNVCVNANIPFLQLSLTYQSLSQMEKDGYVNNFEFKLDGEIIFSLMCKLEGLFTLNGENDFFEYRRTIFECLNLIQEIKTNIEEAAQ